MKIMKINNIDVMKENDIVFLTLQDSGLGRLKLNAPLR